MEFFKLSNGLMDGLLLALFNYVFDNGMYPSAWSTSLINTIYKQKQKTIPVNYRKISLLPCSSNLFESVLNNRLTFCKEMLPTNDPMQNGFKTTFAMECSIEKIIILEGN